MKEKSYLYFYKGKFRTEVGLRCALIKDGIIWTSRGTFYLHEATDEYYRPFDELRDRLRDRKVITEEEYKHFQKWINDKTKSGEIKVVKNMTWYHCEETDGVGDEWEYILEALRDDDFPIETEEEVIENYCDECLDEEQFRIFELLPECRQSAIARKWRIEKYESNINEH